jgi:protein TonB
MFSRVMFAAAALAGVGTLSSPLFAHEAPSQGAPPVYADQNVGAETHGVSGGHSAASFVAFKDWNARVQQALNENLEYPQSIGPYSSGTGIVRIKFNCSDSGRPDKVTLVKSSGEWLLDKAAIRAVSRVATLHPLPTGFKHGQRFEAQVVFASSEYDARLKAVAAAQARHNAWYRDPSPQAKADGERGKTQIALNHAE